MIKDSAHDLIRLRGVSPTFRARALTDAVEDAFRLLTPGEERAVREAFGFTRNDALEDVSPQSDALLCGVVKLRAYASAVLAIFL